MATDWEMFQELRHRHKKWRIQWRILGKHKYYVCSIPLPSGNQCCGTSRQMRAAIAQSLALAANDSKFSPRELTDEERSSLFGAKK